VQHKDRTILSVLDKEEEVFCYTTISYLLNRGYELKKLTSRFRFRTKNISQGYVGRLLSIKNTLQVVK